MTLPSCLWRPRAGDRQLTRERRSLPVGWILAIWSTPTMSVAHLLFAAGTTVYILVAIVFEERDLVEVHGDQYEEYRRTTPALIPRSGLKRPTSFGSSDRTTSQV